MAVDQSRQDHAKFFFNYTKLRVCSDCVVQQLCDFGTQLLGLHANVSMLLWEWLTCMHLVINQESDKSMFSADNEKGSPSDHNLSWGVGHIHVTKLHDNYSCSC